MRFATLLPCPGPASNRPCGDGALVEAGNVCAGCRHAQARAAERAEKGEREAGGNQLATPLTASYAVARAWSKATAGHRKERNDRSRDRVSERNRRGA